MKNVTVALAALSAMLAVSGTALANDVTSGLLYPKSPRAEEAQTLPKTYALDFMSTRSIVKTGKKVVAEQPADADAPSGIDVNPWIVPSFR